MALGDIVSLYPCHYQDHIHGTSQQADYTWWGGGDSIVTRRARFDKTTTTTIARLFSCFQQGIA
jgi:hypothetical protein